MDARCSSVIVFVKPPRISQNKKLGADFGLSTTETGHRRDFTNRKSATDKPIIMFAETACD
jgi:hypothetical protein